MDKYRNECDEGESFGCIVKYKLLHPDQCFVGDKVGGTITGSSVMCIQILQGKRKDLSVETGLISE